MVTYSELSELPVDNIDLFIHINYSQARLLKRVSNILHVDQKGLFNIISLLVNIYPVVSSGLCYLFILAFLCALMLHLCHLSLLLVSYNSAAAH